MLGISEHLFWNHVLTKSLLKRLLTQLVLFRGSLYTAQLLDQLKHLGFHYSTQQGISLGIDDLMSSPLRTWLIQDTEQETYLSHHYVQQGYIHVVERLRQLVESWHTASEFLKRDMSTSFHRLNPLNPVHMMAFSGARGNPSQVHQLVGMRGLITDPAGKIIDFPIQNNLREGLSITEYLISCYGARKGVVDTAIRTADAGYLTRRLVQVAQALIIRHVDCYTPHGLQLNALTIPTSNTSLSVTDRLIGRIVAKPVLKHARCLAARNEDLSAQLARRLMQETTTPVSIRSPLLCRAEQAICQMCYGWGAHPSTLVALGEAVGIIAAQSIGEPGTQLTLRTFHTGGVFTGDIAHLIRAPLNGILHFDLPSCQATRNRHGRLAWQCEREVKLHIQGAQTVQIIHLPAGSLIVAGSGHFVAAQQVLAEVRSTTPLKEQVQRAVYAGFSGEVLHIRSVLPRSTSAPKQLSVSHQLHHLLVLAARVLTSLTPKILTTCYRSEDSLTTILPVIVEPHPRTSLSTLMPCIGAFPPLGHTTAEGTVDATTRTFRRDLMVLTHLHHYTLDTITAPRLTGLWAPLWLCNPFASVSETADISGNRWLGVAPRQDEVIPLWHPTHPFARLRATSVSYRPGIGRRLGWMLALQRHASLYRTLCDGLCIGNYVWQDHIYPERPIRQQAGQVMYLGSQACIFRVFQAFLLPINAVVHVPCYHSVGIGNKLMTFLYEQLQTSDIVQGLPQADKLFEGRPTLQVIANLDILWQGYQQLYAELQALSIKDYTLAIHQVALEHTQRRLLEAIQSVYLAQGVRILDRHLEVIIRQMTTQGMVVDLPAAQFLADEEAGKTVLSPNCSFSCRWSEHESLPSRLTVFTPMGLQTIQASLRQALWLPGELVHQHRLEAVNRLLGTTNAMTYRPCLLGISRASLGTQSFLSEASFQYTTRILVQAALEGRIDWLVGLQEQVLFSTMISAGTGWQEWLYTVFHIQRRYVRQVLHQSALWVNAAIYWITGPMVPWCPILAIAHAKQQDTNPESPLEVNCNVIPGNRLSALKRYAFEHSSMAQAHCHLLQQITPLLSTRQVCQSLRPYSMGVRRTSLQRAVRSEDKLNDLLASSARKNTSSFLSQ